MSPDPQLFFCDNCQRVLFTEPRVWMVTDAVAEALGMTTDSILYLTPECPTPECSPYLAQVRWWDKVPDEIELHPPGWAWGRVIDLRD